LTDGRVHASGPIGSVIDSEVLSSAFGIPVVVSRFAGRFAARGDS